MARFTYLTRLCKDEFSQNNPAYNFEINVPRFCPCCQMPQRGTVDDKKIWNLGNGQHYGTILYTCSNCGKKFLANYDLDTINKRGSFGSFYPVLEASYENDILEPASPRFVQLYTQALRSEIAGDIDLAATGYRDALECLIKDYAINELGFDRDDVVKMPLFKAIEKYLDPDMAKSADVVRILGNDFTYYQRKYPEHDFNVLKTYMDYSISLIEREIKIRHPPVERT